MNPDHPAPPNDAGASAKGATYGYGAAPGTMERVLRRERAIRSLVVLVLGMVAMIVAVGCFGSIYSIHHSTCLDCRAVMVEETNWGFPTKRIETDEASAALLARDPRHEHRWRTNGSTHYHSWLTTTFACGHQHPIWQLPASLQAKYATLVSPAEYRESLRIIDGKDREAAMAEVQRIGELVLKAE